jgi:hypothetical protein
MRCEVCTANADRNGTYRSIETPDLPVRHLNLSNRNGFKHSFTIFIHVLIYIFGMHGEENLHPANVLTEHCENLLLLPASNTHRSGNFFIGSRAQRSGCCSHTVKSLTS